ncbi:hypothetical protein L596_020393 [Steinernema carpocapsae]|uniref:Uncharacterized protein n=1 Tax=Steinernema carpocapsae TaxID=34508 RepID=A0A4U5MTD9_STECR|nr:hypothetical protein L596_020393 [Steinernema carpocapsae]
MIRAVSIHRRKRNRSSSMPHRRLMATNSTSTDAGTSTKSNVSGVDVDARRTAEKLASLQYQKSLPRAGSRGQNVSSTVARLRSAALQAAEGSSNSGKYEKGYRLSEINYGHM